MIGNLESNLDQPFFLLDESLTPVVAHALQLVGYRITTVESEFGYKGIPDPDIINWCQRNDAVWIHADDRARRAHRALLQTSGIRTLRLHRPGGRMTGKEQLRILSFALPKLLELMQQSRRVRNFRVSAQNPLSTPRLTTESI